MADSASGPTASVLICTHNGANRLPETLRHLALQRDPGMPWSVVVVDNASTDRSASVARQCWTRSDVPLRVLSEPRLGVAHARLRGLGGSPSVYICLVDDDNWLSEGYLAKALQVMDEHPEVAVVGGQGQVVAAPGCQIPDWFEDFCGWYAIGPQAAERGRPRQGWVYGAGMMVRSSAVTSLLASGFTFSGPGRKGRSLRSGEDVELCVALAMRGWGVWFEPDLVFQHYMPEERLQWPYFLRLVAGSGTAGVAIERLQGVRLAPRWRLTVI